MSFCQCSKWTTGANTTQLSRNKYIVSAKENNKKRTDNVNMTKTSVLLLARPVNQNNNPAKAKKRTYSSIEEKDMLRHGLG